jgi:hypothetical protein
VCESMGVNLCLCVHVCCMCKNMGTDVLQFPVGLFPDKPIIN